MTQLHTTQQQGAVNDPFQPVLQAIDITQVGPTVLVALSDSEKFVVGVLSHEAAAQVMGGEHRLQQFSIVKLQAWEAQVRAGKDVLFVRALQLLGHCEGQVGDPMAFGDYGAGQGGADLLDQAPQQPRQKLCPWAGQCWPTRRTWCRRGHWAACPPQRPSRSTSRK